MVCDILDIGHLEKCDHQALYWKTQIKSEKKVNSRTVYDYVRADVASMAAALNEVDDCWNDFKQLLLALESRYVPVKTVHAKTKPLWLTHRALKSIKR